jgi:uncharacterized protein YecA (UPF0149 family)
VLLTGGKFCGKIKHSSGFYIYKSGRKPLPSSAENQTLCEFFRESLDHMEKTEYNMNAKFVEFATKFVRRGTDGARSSTLNSRGSGDE